MARDLRFPSSCLVICVSRRSASIRHHALWSRMAAARLEMRAGRRLFGGSRCLAATIMQRLGASIRAPGVAEDGLLPC